MSEANSPLMERLLPYVGTAAVPTSTGRDPVNPAMINQWCDAMGDRNPLYQGGDAVSPPLMLQSWAMHPFSGGPPRGGMEVLHILDQEGFTGVVATNADTEIVRYLTLGEKVTQECTVTEITPEKATKLGTGHFVTMQWTYTDEAGAVVGRVKFRVLKFRPPKAAAAAPAPSAEAGSPKIPRPRPVQTRDTAFFWEGLADGRLLYRQCADCGRVQHPPTPMCRSCGSLNWETKQSSGRGTVHSYVVMYHPPVPPFEYPNPIVLVDLEEGWRLVAEIRGIEPTQVKIDMAVQAHCVEVEPGYWLPQFRPR